MDLRELEPGICPAAGIWPLQSGYHTGSTAALYDKQISGDFFCAFLPASIRHPARFPEDRSHYSTAGHKER